MAESLLMTKTEEEIDQMLAEAMAYQPADEPIEQEPILGSSDSSRTRRKRKKKMTLPRIDFTPKELEHECLDTDPVLITLRQGIENCKQIVQDILPTCVTGMCPK